jgi:diguanylate cyclase (GGDEF)-like protein
MKGPQCQITNYKRIKAGKIVLASDAAVAYHRTRQHFRFLVPFNSMKKISTALLKNTLLECVESGCQAIALFDADDYLRFANEAFLNLFAISGAEGLTFIGMMRDCYEQKKGLVIESSDFLAWISDVQSRRRHIRKRSFEADFIDGRWVWFTESIRPDGWLYINGTDITALKNSEKALRHARDSALLVANTDPLTGLFNRRFAFSQLREAIERLSDAGQSFSICVLDLDHFKKINDTYGHPVGDRVLQHFSDLVRSQLRPADIISRIGGEEFLLLLPNTSIAAATLALVRIRRALRKAPALAETPELKYTFSAGATEACHGDSEESLICRSDAALYSAKQTGRNRDVVGMIEQPKTLR